MARGEGVAAAFPFPVVETLIAVDALLLVAVAFPCCSINACALAEGCR